MTRSILASLLALCGVAAGQTTTAVKMLYCETALHQFEQCFGLPVAGEMRYEPYIWYSDAWHSISEPPAINSDAAGEKDAHHEYEGSNPDLNPGEPPQNIVCHARDKFIDAQKVVWRCATEVTILPEGMKRWELDSLPVPLSGDICMTYSLVLDAPITYSYCPKPIPTDARSPSDGMDGDGDYPASDMKCGPSGKEPMQACDPPKQEIVPANMSGFRLTEPDGTVRNCHPGDKAEFSNETVACCIKLGEGVGAGCWEKNAPEKTIGEYTDLHETTGYEIQSPGDNGKQGAGRMGCDLEGHCLPIVEPVDVPAIKGDWVLGAEADGKVPETEAACELAHVLFGMDTEMRPDGCYARRPPHCDDPARVLFTSEDGKHHCVKF